MLLNFSQVALATSNTQTLVYILPQKELRIMFMKLESRTANIASRLYISGHSKIARPIDRLSWYLFDRCPDGYKGKRS